MQANGDFLGVATARVLLLASTLLAPQVMADNLTVELSRGDQPLTRVASVTRCCAKDARVGDSLRLSSDFGDVYLSVSSDVAPLLAIKSLPVAMTLARD